MGAGKIVTPYRAATAVLVANICLAACLGPKGEKGVRADEPQRAAGSGLTITGVVGDQLLARIYQIQKREENGVPMLDIVMSLNDGSRSALRISPWPLALVACAPAECGIEVELIQNPDGPESRVKISRKGRLVAMAAAQSRLRALPGAAPFRFAARPAAKTPGGRVPVALKLGEVAVPLGKTTPITIEKHSCDFHLFDASVAAEGRPGIAEESPAFAADWVVACN